MAKARKGAGKEIAEEVVSECTRPRAVQGYGRSVVPHPNCPAPSAAVSPLRDATGSPPEVLLLDGALEASMLG